MDDVEAEPILRTLVAHEVDFVVIGGMAARMQGSPLPTQDLDITPDLAPANLTRLSAALRELDARVRHPDVPEGLPFSDDAMSLASTNLWNLTTRHGDLDLAFTPAGTAGYSDLVAGVVVVTLRGTSFPVAGLADIVRSKDAANRDEDRRTLPVLRELLAAQTRARAARDAPPSAP